MIDRFSHFVMLCKTADVKAETTAEKFFKHLVCRFGLPERVTSDGGSAFIAGIFEDMLRCLGTKHHVSCAGHPEGHGAVERMNYTVTQVIRSQFARKTDWTVLVAPAEWAINTTVSTSTGRTPFLVLHCWEPRTPLKAALDVPPQDAGIADDPTDPVSFTEALVIEAARIHAEVRRFEAERFEMAAAYIRKNAQPPRRYREGDFVLLYRDRPEKLLCRWIGPMIIVGTENDYIYTVRNVLTNEVKRVHANILHPFIAGGLTQEQIRFEATEHDEYLVEAVLAHKRKNRELWLQVKWTGYAFEEAGSWVRHSDCRFAPKVKEYLSEHHLKP
jgi:hypothetical protein